MPAGDCGIGPLPEGTRCGTGAGPAHPPRGAGVLADMAGPGLARAFVGIGVGAGAICPGGLATAVVLSTIALGRAGSSVPRTFGADICMTLRASVMASGTDVTSDSVITARGSKAAGVVALANSTKLCCSFWADYPEFPCK